MMKSFTNFLQFLSYLIFEDYYYQGLVLVNEYLKEIAAAISSAALSVILLLL